MTTRDKRSEDAAAIWMSQRDAGAVCEVDCGCGCHDVDDPPCDECCTFVEDEK